MVTNNLVQNIYIFRHSEKPFIDDIYKETTLTYTGLTQQGLVRSFYLETYINNVLNIPSYEYELHTFIDLNRKNTIPNSRTYYTSQFLKPHKTIFYDTFDVIKLIHGIKQSVNKYIIIVWEHIHTLKLLNQLFNLKLTINDYVNFSNIFFNETKPNKKNKIVTIVKTVIKNDDIPINALLCNPLYNKINKIGEKKIKNVQDECLYALYWVVIMSNHRALSLDVNINFIVKQNKNDWIAQTYIDIKQKNIYSQ
jgi:hypothetical protein